MSGDLLSASPAHTRVFPAGDKDIQHLSCLPTPILRAASAARNGSHDGWREKAARNMWSGSCSVHFFPSLGHTQLIPTGAAPFRGHNRRHMLFRCNASSAAVLILFSAPDARGGFFSHLSFKSPGPSNHRSPAAYTAFIIGWDRHASTLLQAHWLSRRCPFRAATPHRGWQVKNSLIGTRVFV